MTKAFCLSFVTAAILLATAEWSKEKNPARAAQGKDTSSPNVNLRILSQVITMAAEANKPAAVFLCCVDPAIVMAGLNKN
jgi:hypothetical protein